MDPTGAAVGASCTRVFGGSVVVWAGWDGCGRSARLGHPLDRCRPPGGPVPDGAGPVRGLQAVREELEFHDSSDDESDDESKDPADEQTASPERPEAPAAPEPSPAPPAPPLPSTPSTPSSTPPPPPAPKEPPPPAPEQPAPPPEEPRPLGSPAHRVNPRPAPP